MNIMEMQKSDFKNIPYRKNAIAKMKFHSIVIVPTGNMHESGFMCMDFVAVNGNLEPICKLSGMADVIHLNGIGGYGKNISQGMGKGVAPIDGWALDCLPCGYLRLFCNRDMETDDRGISDFSVYGVGE